MFNFLKNSRGAPPPFSRLWASSDGLSVRARKGEIWDVLVCLFMNIEKGKCQRGEKVCMCAT